VQKNIQGADRCALHLFLLCAGFVKAALKSVESDQILEGVDGSLGSERYRLPLSDVQVVAAISFKEEVEKFVALL
jgi:hypothetical protein